jgi:hypothetical protein
MTSNHVSEVSYNQSFFIQKCSIQLSVLIVFSSRQYDVNKAATLHSLIMFLGKSFLSDQAPQTYFNDYTLLKPKLALNFCLRNTSIFT